MTIDRNSRDALEGLPNKIIWVNILGSDVIVMSNWRNNTCYQRNDALIKILTCGVVGSYRDLSYD